MNEALSSSSWPPTVAPASPVSPAAVVWSARTRSTAAAPSSARTASGRLDGTRRGKSRPKLATQLDLAVGSPDADVQRLREQVREQMRNEPGVYLMRGVHGEVLYVGKSTQVRTRLLSYFRLPWPEHRHARLLRETARIEWEPMPSEFAALLREVRLIRAHLPKYNIKAARPLDKWWVITVAGGPAPRLRIQRASAAARAKQAAQVIGPFASRRPLVEALRVLNDALGLRDCTDRVPMVLHDAVDLFDDMVHPSLTRTPGCHRYETRRCLGPCVGATTEYAYRAQLSRARAVLEGRDDSPHQQLVREMSAASAALSYERAGWLRDRLTALQELDAQLARVREAITKPSFVYAMPGRDGDDRLYLVRHGRVVAEARCREPESVTALQALEQRGVQAPTGAVVDQLDELLMIESWFRTRPNDAVYKAETVVGALETLVRNSDRLT
ncbi:GIY-YIG nuclease family protein [Gemmatimonas groenlandica]|uniref:GIY-YIG nuclease family protein n=2 Tax=Gemmatimonas groenlandica TaxID=2732249 RepID=A0A6M4IKP4_9BACT|nr:GIY-YIG nuclease family protein [Gemmatimonas groenlandica]